MCCLRKILENPICVFHEQIFFHSCFIFYRKKIYRSQDVLLRLLEQQRKNFQVIFVNSRVLMDLPETFACFLHDLLISKLAAYRINENLQKRYG